MRNIRVIGRLDVKTNFLVKGIHLEGLRKLGPPNDFSTRYYQQGIDELLYVDIVASLYERNSLIPVIKEASDNIFIPLTVTGGIRSLENAKEALHSGADKVGVNTASIKSPELISEIADSYGSQCMVSSIEAKRTPSGKWEAYYDNGREKTGIDALEWAVEVEKLGAGELLVTSVDQEGTGKGMDVELIQKVCDRVNIPVIASGGAGSLSDVEDVVKKTGLSGLALANVLHYEKLNIQEIKDHLRSLSGIEVR